MKCLRDLRPDYYREVYGSDDEHAWVGHDVRFMAQLSDAVKALLAERHRPTAKL